MGLQKTCKRCGEPKSLDGFERHRAVCRECRKLDCRKWRRQNPEHTKAYDQKRKDKPKRKQQIAAAKKRFEKRHPEKFAAWKETAHLRANGVLVLDRCETEGCPNKATQAHHPDYSQKDWVIGLCDECHGKTRRLPCEPEKIAATA